MKREMKGRNCQRKGELVREKEREEKEYVWREIKSLKYITQEKFSQEREKGSEP